MIVPPSFLFQYQLPILRVDDLPRKERGLVQLPDATRVFVPSSLNDVTSGLDLKLAWNPEGLAIEIAVKGKVNPPTGRERDLRHSDYVQIYIDTRHTASVHRATEFCSAWRVIPADEAAKGKPTVQLIDLAQQRGTRRQQDAGRVMIAMQNLSGGYQLELWIPAGQLPGFSEIAEIGHLGFYLVVEDTELGQLPLSIGGDFPVAHDPSTWLQLILI